MLELNGFWIDEFNCITYLASENDRSDENGWYLITLNKEYIADYKNYNEYKNITFNIPQQDDSIFSMKKIDINNFEWNGKSLRLEFDKK